MATISGTFFLSVFHLAFPEILGAVYWIEMIAAVCFQKAALSAQKVAVEIHECTLYIYI